MMMLICMLAAAIVGFAAHRGGTCGVAAVRQLLDGRDARLLVGFVAASGAATLVCLPLAWALGRGAALPGSVPIGGLLVAGSVLLGVGAVTNGACLVGSLWRMGNGEVHMAGLPLGIVAGDVAGRLLGWQVIAPPSRFARPDAAGLALVAGGAALLLLAGLWLGRRGPGGLRLLLLMAAMGAAGSLLFVVLPGWTWVEVVNSQATAFLGSGMTSSMAALSVTLATLAGALASGWLTGSLRWHWRGWAWAARSMAGGVLMMLGVRLIPGGNDALLLGAAPAGAISAVAAFALMNLTIWIMLATRQTRRAAPAGQP